MKRRLKRARELSPGTRLWHLADPIYRRAPTPYVVRTAHRLGLPPREVLAHFNEARAGDLTDQLVATNALQQVSGHIGALPGAFLYALVRTMRPTVIVETGVASGMSSMFILAALAENQRGRLVSIDLPFTESDGEPMPIIAGTSIEKPQWSPVPPGREPGWLVPLDLRDRWELRLGDARLLLPQVLQEVGPADIFLHDSLHTFDHMLFEFQTAWPQIAPGGLLASDDLTLSPIDPFQRFAREIRAPYVMLGSMGFIRKPA